MKLLREPLVHFLALGAALFALSAVLGERGTTQDRIVVTSGQIEHLAATFARTWQRPPTPPELQALIDAWVREEIYAREARALGLDLDDTVIRRRLWQKMEFLVEDAAATPPSEAELQAYLTAHPDAFRTEPRLSFRQVFVSPDRRGDGAASDAVTLLERLRAAGPGADIAGDRLGVPDELQRVPRSEITRLFGDVFAARLESVEPGAWVARSSQATGSISSSCASASTGGCPRSRRCAPRSSANGSRHGGRRRSRRRIRSAVRAAPSSSSPRRPRKTR